MDAISTLKNLDGMSYNGDKFSLHIAGKGEIELFQKTDDQFLIMDNNVAKALCVGFQGKSVDTPESSIKEILRAKIIELFESESHRVKDVLAKLQVKPYHEMLTPNGAPSPLIKQLDQLRVTVVEATLNGALFRNGKSEFVKQTVKDYTMLNQIMLEFDSFDVFTRNLVNKLNGLMLEFPEGTNERKNMVKNLDAFASSYNYKEARPWFAGKSTTKIESTTIRDMVTLKKEMGAKPMAYPQAMSTIGKCLN